jgi:hypothetical protein
MEQIRYPEEIKQADIEYRLQKYINGIETWKIIFNRLSDGKLERILNDIKGESP